MTKSEFLQRVAVLAGECHKLACDVHNALADARHQAKYVSAIWQKLIPATSTNE